MYSFPRGPVRLRTLSAVFAAALALPAGGQVRADEAFRLSPTAAVLELAAEPAEPTAAGLLAAAVLFSGADPARAAAATAAGLQAIAIAEGYATETADHYERGARVLELVHSLLVRYELLESRMDRTLLEGRYNCVGSSSLYTILARAAGLAVRGVILEDHAYCYLVMDGRRVDVETTSPRGYDQPPERPGATPPVDVPARGIVALALRNRATLLERSSRWSEALALAVDAFAYMPDAWTFETLTGRVNNCVAALLRAGRHADALALAEAALAAYGPEPSLESLWKTARTAALTEALRKAGPDEALALAEEALASGEFETAWLENAFAFAYAGLAEELRRDGDHLGAWRLAEAAASRFGASAELAALARTAKGNWVKASHNRFATLYNAGTYDEALAVLRAALELAPGERILQDDLKTAEAALAAAGN